MPRKEKLPPREVEICHRLRAFRAGRKIARTVFAKTIEIGPERLASYESARAPVRYEVFQAINRHFFINAPWLAGDPISSVSSIAPLDDTGLVTQADGRELFSVVYEMRLKSHFHEVRNQIAESLYGAGGTWDKSEKLSLLLNDYKAGKKIPREELRKLYAALQKLVAQLDESLADDDSIEAKLKDIRSSGSDPKKYR